MSPGRQDFTDKSLRVLVVGSDRVLEEEFRSALNAVPGRQGIVHFSETYRDALDEARRRQPDLAVIELDRDTLEILGFIRDLRALAPGVVLAGAYRNDRFDQGRSDGAVLIDLFRAQVRDFVRRPVSTTELRAVLDRLFEAPGASASSDRGRLVAFVSNKGGVGRSTLAVNVACGLALRHPDDVLLVDASVHVGTCALMLDLKPQTGLVDAVRERDRLDKTLLRHLSMRHESGLRLLAAPTDALDAADIDDEAVGRIVNLARQSFRYVIVDTFAVLDNTLMTVLDLADLAFVVIQGTAPAVACAARFLPLLEGLGVAPARQRLVLNRNYKSFLGDLRPTDVADRLARDLDHVVPYDHRVLVSMNTGRPQIMNVRPWHRFGRALSQIIDDVDGAVPGVPATSASADAVRRGDRTDRERAR